MRILLGQRQVRLGAGAGGVEGLLAVSMDGVFYIPCYDHNGNIVRYVSETGATAAQYVYDPYGSVIDSIGDLADEFSFGFSTKYHDRETGMVNYQRRFYLPGLGRWLNRDPIEEEGGENLYAFCRNSPIMNYDVKGCGVWNFNDTMPPLVVIDNDHSIVVTYEMDDTERKCCKQVFVRRYVRTLIPFPPPFPQLTGGLVGPYMQDGDDEQSFSHGNKGYAPVDWPEGPGVRIPFTDIGY